MGTFEFITPIDIQNIIFEFFNEYFLLKIHYTIKCITKSNVFMKINDELNKTMK
jgi:hypothetical protein